MVKLQLTSFIKLSVLEAAQYSYNQPKAPVYRSFINDELWLFPGGKYYSASDIGHEEFAENWTIEDVLNKNPDAIKPLLDLTGRPELSTREIKTLLRYDKKIPIAMIQDFFSPVLDPNETIKAVRGDSAFSGVLVHKYNAFRTVLSPRSISFDVSLLTEEALRRIYNFIITMSDSIGYNLTDSEIVLHIFQESNPQKYGTMKISEFIKNDYKMPGNFWHDALTERY